MSSKTIKDNQAGDSAATLDERRLTHEEMKAFALTGRLPADFQNEISRLKLLPALLHGYRDLSRIRHDYPLILIDDENGRYVTTLTMIVDEFLEEHDTLGDEGERFRRDVLKLESEVRILAEGKSGVRFQDLLKQAAQRLLAASPLQNEKKNVFMRNIDQAVNGLKKNGEIVPCDDDTPVRVLEGAWRLVWREKTAEFARELESLIRALEGILRADRRNQAGDEAELLRRQLEQGAGSDLDYDALADILSHKVTGEPLPAERRERIESSLKILQSGLVHFAPDREGHGSILAENCSQALVGYRSRLREMTEFFRAVRMARLEQKDKYQDAHNAYFKNFSLADLTVEELKLIPAYLVRIREDRFDAENMNALFQILSSQLPIKVLIQPQNACECGPLEEGAIFGGWSTQLARMATALNGAFVLQTVNSQLYQARENIRRGLEFDGPSLISVYSGSRDIAPHLSSYLDSAAALASRTFPTFVYDPAAGDDWSARFSLEQNPSPDSIWPLNDFSVREESGSVVNLQLAFTFADFIGLDVRMTDSFLPVSTLSLIDQMIPVGDYLDMDADATQDMIPYLFMVNEDDTLYYVVVRRNIIEAARASAGVWRSLRELGGIDNSHVRRALTLERERQAEEQRLEIERIKEEFQEQYDKTVGELRDEIIGNIASSLLEGGIIAPAAGGVRTTAAPAAASGAVPAGESAAATAEAPAAEEEEEAISFDEAYIETPRCTSCNECINRNNKLFVYNENKQALIADVNAGTFRDLVESAELCPVRIIHPGKPVNPGEPGLDDLVKRAEPFNG